MSQHSTNQVKSYGRTAYIVQSFGDSHRLIPLQALVRRTQHLLARLGLNCIIGGQDLRGIKPLGGMEDWVEGVVVDRAEGGWVDGEVDGGEELVEQFATELFGRRAGIPGQTL